MSMMKRATPSSSSRDPVKKRLSGIFKNNRDSLASASRPGSVSRYNASASMRRDQGPQRDPRNLSNRAKQREMIEDILSFLQLNGYPHEISQKILQAPTSKDFVKLFEFLYGFIDKKEKIEKKFEEEVPRLLKQICYPFTIPKSTMFTIGSLHTWPTLLGALHWLVELIEYCLKVDPDHLLFCQDSDDPFYGCDMIFNRYYEKTYKDFINGEPSSEEDDLRLTDAILRQAGAINENDEALQQEVSELEKELAELEAEPNRLSEMENNIAFMKSECEKMEENKQDYINEKKTLDMKQKKQNDELQKYDMDKIRQIQGAGSLDHQMQQLRNKLEAVNIESEKLQSRCWEKEMNFSKTYSRVDKILSEYNDHVRNLSCDKRAMEYLKGQDISMKFDHHEKEILDPTRFRDTIKDLLFHAQNEVSSDVLQLESQRITEEDKLEKMTEFCAEEQRVISVAEKKLDALTAEVEAMQENVAREQKQAEDELSVIREEIKDLETSSSSHLEKRQRELVDLKERMKKAEEEITVKSQKAAQFLLMVVETMSEHKAKIEAGVNKLHDDKLRQVNELRNKTYPWQNLLDKDKTQDK